MTDYAALTHDDLPPCPVSDAHPPRPSGEWRSRKDEEKAARGRLLEARLRAIGEPVGDDLRVGCRGTAFLADLDRAAPESGWRVLEPASDDQEVLRIAGVLRGRAPDSPVALARDPASGEPFAAWLTVSGMVNCAWPHHAALRLALVQDAALPGRVRDSWPRSAPGEAPPMKFVDDIAQDLTRTRRERVAAQLAAMRDRRPFVPKGAGVGDAVPLPGDEEAF